MFNSQEGAALGLTISSLHSTLHGSHHRVHAHVLDDRQGHRVGAFASSGIFVDWAALKVNRDHLPVLCVLTGGCWCVRVCVRVGGWWV